MATLREMLVKIYRPRQGVIEFGPGNGSTQDGATGLAVLGGQPGQGEDEGQGLGGSVDFPEYRYAGIEGGGAGGGGLSPEGFDWSQFDPNDPQQYAMARELFERGGQAGEPGGAGAGGIEYGPDQYVDPTLAELVGYFGPGPLGLVGSIGAAGMRGYNAGLLSDELGRAGYDGLSGLQQAGALFGFNSYGAGDPRGTFGAQGIGGLAEAAYEAQTNRGVFDSLNDPAMGVSANQRARSDTRGGRAAESSSYGGAKGRSAAARHAERSSYTDRGGRGAEGGGRGGGSDQGGSANDRDNAPDGRYHDGGMVYGAPGEEVTGELLAGEFVLSPEAVGMVGRQNLEQVNNLARMMGRQHYPPR